MQSIYALVIGMTFTAETSIKDARILSSVANCINYDVPNNILWQYRRNLEMSVFAYTSLSKSAIILLITQQNVSTQLEQG